MNITIGQVQFNVEWSVVINKFERQLTTFETHSRL